MGGTPARAGTCSVPSPVRDRLARAPAVCPRSKHSVPHTRDMEVDRVTWQLAASRVRRAAQVARLVWWMLMLAPPLVAFAALPELFLASLVAALASLVLARRIVFRLLAGGTVGSVHTVLGTAGPDLTRLQVAQLLLDGSTEGRGSTWVTVHDGAQVRLVAEGRGPGAPARSSSPWVWAMGGGGGA